MEYVGCFLTIELHIPDRSSVAKMSETLWEMEDLSQKKIEYFADMLYNPI